MEPQDGESHYRTRDNSRMKYDQNNPDSVTHRTKGNKPARKLADEPEFLKLAGLVNGGKIDKRRTIDHITTEADHERKED